MQNPKLNSFKDYLNWFANLPEEQQREEARASLIRSGVLNEDGTRKEQIVTLLNVTGNQ